MRNIFDQYTQPENRLTHALVSSLAAEPLLLRKFVRWVTGERLFRGRKLEVFEQRLPGEEEEAITEDEAERRGLPDAWIHDGGRWGLIIESKIESSLTRDQLERHRRVAKKRGFANSHLLALVTEIPQRFDLDDVKILTWSQLYSWLTQEGGSQWAKRLSTYMEVLERKLVTEEYLKEGTLTVFSGIPFGKDNPYNYYEAKRVLRLAMNDLRKRTDLKRQLGMDPEGKGRPAITGREGTAVWDFLPLAKAKNAKYFTEFPHLTLGIQRDRLKVNITVPNGIRRDFRGRLISNSKEAFLGLIEQIAKNLTRIAARLDGVSPRIELVQRHYPSQRANPIVDADLRFDLRTAFAKPTRGRKAIKTQPQWLTAVYDALKHKDSNLQFAVGAVLYYDRCQVVNSPKILMYIAEVWIACNPLIRRALGYDA
jgi:hypothetical protein